MDPKTRARLLGKKTIIHVSSPCPCNSGKAMSECHLDVDLKLRKPRPNLQPPAPVTGYSHPNCYLGGTRDCCDEISREHYVSRTVLEKLGQVLKLSGAYWQKSGETLETTLPNLTAKILCRRHNSALSPLDVEAGLFLSLLLEVVADLDKKSLSRRHRLHLVSGEALELWLLKIACGLYFGIAAKDGKRLSDSHTINIEKVSRALFEGRWGDRAGLYFRGATGSALELKGEVVVNTLTDDAANLLAGAVISLIGFQLECLFETGNANPGVWSGVTRRPTELTITDGRRKHSIVLTWPPGTPEATVVVMKGKGPVPVERLLNDP